jgi:hypothetical protein
MSTRALLALVVLTRQILVLDSAPFAVQTHTQIQWVRQLWILACRAHLVHGPKEEVSWKKIVFVQTVYSWNPLGRKQYSQDNKCRPPNSLSLSGSATLKDCLCNAGSFQVS